MSHEHGCRPYFWRCSPCGSTTWLAQLSIGEQERRLTILDAAAVPFQEDYDRELTRAYGTFESALYGEMEGREHRLFVQHAVWLNEAPFGPMVRDVYWCDANAPGRFRRLSYEEQWLVPSDWPPGVSAGEVDRAKLLDPDGPTTVRRNSVVISDPPYMMIPYYGQSRK